MIAVSVGAKRSISAAQLASRDAGATNRLVRRGSSRVRRRLHHQQQRQHLHRLAEAHVVGEAGAQAETGEQVQPSHADLLIGAQSRLQRCTGIHVRQLGRIAKAGKRLRQPRPGDDA